MTIYVCDKCQYETKYRHVMTTHLLKKYPCKKQKVMMNWSVMQEINKSGIELLKLESDLLDKQLFAISD